MLKIQEKNKPETAVWLVKVETILSSKGDGDFNFTSEYNDKTVIKLIMDNQQLTIVDVTQNLPLLVNRRRITQPQALGHGDVIEIGDTQYEIIDPKKAMDEIGSKKVTLRDKCWQLQAVGNWLDGQVFTISAKTIIGREKGCGITIPGNHLSRQHAELLPTSTSLIIRDLDSANGTFINGERITEATLKDGDIFKIDILTFKAIAPIDAHLAKKPKPAPEVSKPARLESDLPEPSSVPAAEKQWVTKPTSIGNMLNDSDRILAQHQRQKKIAYSAFALIFLGLVAAAVVLTHPV